jgi:hypothetical protein
MPVFTYPMKLTAATQDERLKAQLDGTLWVTSAFNATTNQPTVAVLQARTDIQSAAQLEAKTGISGLDLNGYESIVFRCSVYYAPEAGMPQGMVILIGESDASNDCSTGPCGPTELLKGMFQQ